MSLVQTLMGGSKEGESVQIVLIVHFNALRETNGAGAAINQAIGFLGARLGA